MEWLSALITGFCGIVTTVITVRGVQAEKKAKKAEEEAAAKKAQAEAEEEERRRRAETMEHGMQAILRYMLIERYNHYRDKGYIPIYALETLNSMFTVYHKMGWNSIATDLMDDLKQLPHEPAGKQ